MWNIKTYISELHSSNYKRYIKQVEREAVDLFNIVECDGKPAITFNGIIITTPQECSNTNIMNKLFTLREIYVKQKTKQ